MKTLTEKLKRYGADPEKALNRLLGDEVFYRSLLREFLQDPDLRILEESLRLGMFREAFRAAHNLKGASATLCLHPLFDCLSVLVEDLRPDQVLPWETDYGAFCMSLECFRHVMEEADAIRTDLKAESADDQKQAVT